MKTTQAELSRLVNRSKQKVQQHREELVVLASSLVSNMQSLIHHLQNDADFLPNELGVVQRLGVDIDRISAVLCVEQRNLDKLESFQELLNSQN